MSEQFPSNSDRSREEAKVVPETGVKARLRGRTLRTLLEDVLIGPASWSDLLSDVILPQAARAVHDAIVGCADAVFGMGARQSGVTYAPGAPYRSYYPKQPLQVVGKPASGGVNQAYRFDDILFQTRADAEYVLSTMNDMLDSFGVVSVADMYDLAGMTCEYTANKYGWTSLSGARTDYAGNGYVLRLPRVMPI